MRIAPAALIIFYFISTLEAQQTRYSFDGNEISKRQELYGKINHSILCSNVTGTDILNGDLVDLNNLFVRSDEKYLTFQVYSKSRPHYFLVDIGNCKVIRELIVDKKYQQIDYSAAYKPVSGDLLISWLLMDKDGEGFEKTIEYRGTEYKNERILKNIQIPSRVIDEKGYYLYYYKFTHDEKYLVTVEPIIWVANVYSVPDDQKLASFKIMDYKKGKFINREGLPDVKDGHLMYSFDSAQGTEISIFDYKDKRLENKIIVPEKGLGKFSLNGDSVIVSTFPDQKTMKKKAFVYDRKTGKRKGSATLDAADEAEDVSDNGKQILLKNGKHAAMEHND